MTRGFAGVYVNRLLHPLKYLHSNNLKYIITTHSKKGAVQVANKKVNPKLKRIPTTVTIPQWLSDELSRLAIEKKVSKGDIVERALLKVIDIKQGVE